MVVNNTNLRQINEDVRQLVIRQVVYEGRKIAEVARMIQRDERSVRRIVYRFCETGDSNALRRGGARGCILNENIIHRLNTLMNDNNIYNLQNLKTLLGLNVSESTIWRWLKKLNYTYKIVRPVAEMRNNEDVKMERVEYVNWYYEIELPMRYRNIIYLDESPFDLHMIRNHGYSLRGTTPNQVLARNRGPNITMILAVNGLNIVHAEAIVGSNVNSVIFRGFLNTLKNILGNDEDFILVMDNVRFHHSTINSYDDYPYPVKFLPRYSPFLNPCEEVFSKIKNLVRGQSTMRGSNELLERMLQACGTITPRDLSNYIGHCESFFPKCSSREDINRE